MSSRRDRLRYRIMCRVEFKDCGAKTQCWLWTGPHSGSGRGGGYPRMSVDGGTMAVHIAMWIIENGPIPPRKQLDHTCRQRMCVNPEHTELVTHRENMKRRDRARITCEAA